MAEAASTQTNKAPVQPAYSRKTLRKMGRAKRQEKLATNKELAKAYFEGKSKRAGDRKAAFRKKVKGKK